MSIRKVYTTLNVRKAESQTTIEGLHVGDVGSTQLVISLMDGTRAIDLTQYDNVTAMIHGKKPDGYEIHNECDVTTDPGKIIYTLTAQDTAVSGTVYYQLDVQINSEERSFSPCFRTQVSERVYEPVFELLTEQEPPTGWAQHYAEYYKKVDDVYVKNNDPTYAADTFYELVDPPIESASEFQAFWSAYNNTLGVFSEVVEARREFRSLSERLENTAAPTDEQVDEAFSDYIDEHPDLFAYATPEQYGAVGDGETDDTAAINECLSENKCVVFRNTYSVNPIANEVTTEKLYKTYPDPDTGIFQLYLDGSGQKVLMDTVKKKCGIVVPSNRKLIFQNGSKIKCKDDPRDSSDNIVYNYALIMICEADNIFIDGLKIQGYRASEIELDYSALGHSATSGIDIGIYGSSNVTINNCDIYNSMGDGIGIWSTGEDRYPDLHIICSNIKILNSTIRENRRNGMSIGASENVKVLNCNFLNNGNKIEYDVDGSTVYGYGRKPRAGVDIEPNYIHNVVKNITFENCVFKGNGNDAAGAPDEESPVSYSFVDVQPKLKRAKKWTEDIPPSEYYEDDTYSVENGFLKKGGSYVTEECELENYIDTIKENRKNLSLINCYDDDEVRFNMSDATVIGGRFRRISTNNVSTVSVSEATTYGITTGSSRGNLTFTDCLIKGVSPVSTEHTISIGSSYGTVELNHCKLFNNICNFLGQTTAAGSLILNDCYVYHSISKYIESNQNKYAVFMENGHLIARGTEFHFEDHPSAVDHHPITVMSLELTNCDFYYPEINNDSASGGTGKFFIFGKANPTLSQGESYTYIPRNWINNRFRNTFYHASSRIDVMGNNLINNWFNLPVAKIVDTRNNVTDLSNVTHIGNIWTDLNENQPYINNNNKLSSDLVDDTDKTNKFVTSAEKTAWNGKANSATTLAGYGITDAYTKTQVDGMIPSVPTKVSDLNNDSGFLTLATLPVYNGGVQ